MVGSTPTFSCLERCPCMTYAPQFNPQGGLCHSIYSRILRASLGRRSRRSLMGPPLQCMIAVRTSIPLGADGFFLFFLIFMVKPPTNDDGQPTYQKRRPSCRTSSPYVYLFLSPIVFCYSSLVLPPHHSSIARIGREKKQKETTAYRVIVRASMLLLKPFSDCILIDAWSVARRLL